MSLLDYEECWMALRSHILQYGDEVQKAVNAPKDWPDFKYQQGKLDAARAIFTALHEMELPSEEAEQEVNHVG